MLPTDDPQRMDAELDAIVPANPNKPYDVRRVVRTIVDDGEFFEIHERYAKNIVCGFARLGGRAVGIVANQPTELAGVLDIDGARPRASCARATRSAAARHVRRRAGLPAGTEQEWDGIIRHGAKLLYAYCEATVPKLTVITRKAYGGAYDVMGCKHAGADFNFAWPTGEIAVMGPEGAVNILFRRSSPSTPTPVARRADRRVPRALREPVLGRRARLRRRRDPPVETRPAHRRARDAADQARRAPQAQARQHPAVSIVAGWRWCSRRRRRPALRDARRPEPVVRRGGHGAPA